MRTHGCCLMFYSSYISRLFDCNAKVSCRCSPKPTYLLALRTSTRPGQPAWAWVSGDSNSILPIFSVFSLVTFWLLGFSVELSWILHYCFADVWCRHSAPAYLMATLGIPIRSWFGSRLFVLLQETSWTRCVCIYLQLRGKSSCEQTSRINRSIEFDWFSLFV